MYFFCRAKSGLGGDGFKEGGQGEGIRTESGGDGGEKAEK